MESFTSKAPDSVFDGQGIEPKERQTFSVMINAS